MAGQRSKSAARHFRFDNTGRVKVGMPANTGGCRKGRRRSPRHPDLSHGGSYCAMPAEAGERRQRRRRSPRQISGGFCHGQRPALSTATTAAEQCSSGGDNMVAAVSSSAYQQIARAKACLRRSWVAGVPAAGTAGQAFGSTTLLCERFNDHVHARLDRVCPTR